MCVQEAFRRAVAKLPYPKSVQYSIVTLLEREFPAR